MKTFALKNSSPRSMEERWEQLENEMGELKRLLQQVLKRLPKESSVEDVLLNVKQVAQLLAIEPGAVYAKCLKADLPYIKIGKLYKFKRSAVQDWMDRTDGVAEVNVEEYVNQYLQNKELRG